VLATGLWSGSQDCSWPPFDGNEAQIHCRWPERWTTQLVVILPITVLMGGIFGRAGILLSLALGAKRCIHIVVERGEPMPPKTSRVITRHPTDFGDAESLSQVVWRLNTLCKTATLSFALGVGELVVTRVYSGDISRFRSREPKGELALRFIANHPDLAMSRVTLYRSIAIYELCERLGMRSWLHVSSSHMRLVLPLCTEDQERLLCEAEANAWSVSQLNEKVGQLLAAKAPEGKRGGRRRVSRLQQASRVVDRFMVTLTDLLQAPARSDADAEMSPESARNAIELLQRTADACVRLEQRIAAVAGFQPKGVADEGACADSSSDSDEETPTRGSGIMEVARPRRRTARSERAHVSVPIPPSSR
jgi:hypothetical protein